MQTLTCDIQHDCNTVVVCLASSVQFVQILEVNICNGEIESTSCPLEEGIQTREERNREEKRDPSAELYESRKTKKGS